MARGSRVLGLVDRPPDTEHPAESTRIRSRRPEPAPAFLLHVGYQRGTGLVPDRTGASSFEHRARFRRSFAERILRRLHQTRLEGVVYEGLRNEEALRLQLFVVLKADYRRVIGERRYAQQVLLRQVLPLLQQERPQH